MVRGRIVAGIETVNLVVDFMVIGGVILFFAIEGFNNNLALMVVLLLVASMSVVDLIYGIKRAKCRKTSSSNSTKEP